MFVAPFAMGLETLHALRVRSNTVILKYDGARCVHRKIQEMNDIKYNLATSVEHVHDKSHFLFLF